MQNDRRPFVIPLLVAIAASLALGAPAAFAADRERYIVVLKDSLDHPGVVASEHAQQHGGDVSHVYRYALKGYAAKLPSKAVDALERDPRVDFVARDHRMGIAAQTIPTGIHRTFAASSPDLDIDGTDDFRVDADVAVIDTGIDFDHPDLNVVGRTNCMGGISVPCADGTGDDGNGHGTHVAGTVGAIDNGIGVVGIAPGARLWGVKVLSDSGFAFESSTVAGVDWVTAHASEIEVANMSLRCAGEPNCSLSALAVAITNSVDDGVVYAVAAGNNDADAASVSPANHPDVITVSALVDYDGLPGGLGNATCIGDVDDTLAGFSNWGATVEVAAPGICILSTWKNGGYHTINGTSMASPHVAGAAAWLASQNNPATRAGVEAIRQKIIDAGNFDWTDDSGDGIKEPLLDVRWPIGPTTESDVDGDGRAELVSLDSLGFARVRGTDGSASTDLGVGLALLDGRGSYAIDVADVTGDGQSDLVTWGNAGGVSVHRGTLDKRFASPVTSLPNWNPSWDGETDRSSEPIGVADVNGDGRADLVKAWSVLGNGLYSLTTHLGQADGTFLDLELASYPPLDSALFDNVGEYLLDAADVDGDGRADVVSLGTSGSARVYRGQADGYFAAPVTAASVNPVLDDGQGEEPVGLADVNLDGRADLVTLDGAGALKLYKGKADATFEAPVSAYAGTIDSSLLDGTGRELVGLLDYNGDGRADLVAIDQQHELWTYAAQAATPTFANPTRGYGFAVVRTFSRGAATDPPYEREDLATEKPVQRRPGCKPSGCAWRSAPTDSDVNGDGRAELVTIDGYDSFYPRPRSYVGTDSGIATETPSLWSGAPLEPPPALLDGDGSYVIDVSDVTGDGQSDLITWGHAGGVAVRRGRYEGSFNSQPVTSLPNWNPSWDGEAHHSSEPIAVADVNGDGRADLVKAWNVNGNGLYSLTTHLGQADGTFYNLELASYPPLDSALFDNVGEYLLDAADVTGDGRADVVSLGTSGSARVYRGQADGYFAAPVTAASINPVLDDGQGEEPVGLADVNLDGRADLVTLDGSGALKLSKGKADATFEAPVSAYAGTIDSSLLDGTGRELVGLLDYNRDGRADLVAIDEQGQVWNYRAQPDATFAAPTSGGSWSWAPTVRIHKPIGHEPASEKNIQRRVGCSTGGCTWPPTP